MTRLLSSTAIAGALLLCGLVSGANADSVTIGSQIPYSGGDAPIYSTMIPNSVSGTFNPSVSGSTGGERSPYETNSTVAGRATPYSVLSADSVGPGTAIYNVTGNNFTILWGSPDDYNHITFWSGPLGTGSDLGTFNGTDTICYTSSCDRLAWDLVTFHNTDGIGSVVLNDSGQAAFEYGLNPLNFTLNPTPLPAAMWLFGTVIAGAAGTARLRRRRKAA